MKVLMISGDEQVLNLNSSAGKRMEEYRNVFGELDILLCSGNIFNFISGFLRGFTFMRRKKFDVITAQSAEHWALAWVFSKFFRVPWQMQIHTDILSPHFAGHSALDRFRVGLAKFLIPKADGIRVVSERIKKSITAHGLKHKTISVLPIFLDVAKVRNASAKIDLREKYGTDKTIILMPTRLTKEKNIGMALNAVNKLPIERRPLLLIVGDGPEKENLKHMAYDLRLMADNVVFEDVVDFETLISYYKTADIYLLTSVYEGGARAPLEALVAGLPVVMTDVAPAHEDIIHGENGLVVPVGDSKVLAVCLADLISNKEKLLKLKKGAENSFLAPISKEKYLELYAKILTDLL